MQLGMIGLGRMGANIVRRIVRDGNTAVGHERHQGHIDELSAELGDSFQGRLVAGALRTGWLYRADGGRYPVD